MAFESVDQLQKILAHAVFHYTQDAKKASGRALGTLVEIITFYLLKTWGFEDSIAIERALPEYGNAEISHNVEYSLHPTLEKFTIALPDQLPLTSTRIISRLKADQQLDWTGFTKTGNTLLNSSKVLRNACTLANRNEPYPSLLMANLLPGDSYRIQVIEQYARPFAIFECKRVGVEEGTRKGPQTIEKAKQGAYVARSSSSLQKIRMPSGELAGLIYKPDGELYTKTYSSLVAEVIASHQAELLSDFVLTVGVVSNHGNWFTSDNHNKELKVLAQSYDWLLFLTDEGLAEFITQVLLKPDGALQSAKRAFLSSYTAGKKKNLFTKVQMDFEANQALLDYFSEHLARIEQWFNPISPRQRSIQELKLQLSTLHNKNWKAVHSL
jgi:hypothetical protein